MLSADATGPNTTTDARVRVVHLSPDAPAVDVLVEGAPAFTGIPFGDVTGYAALPAGTYDVKVEPAGAETGMQRTYFNPLRTFGSSGATTAFPCP